MTATSLCPGDYLGVNLQRRLTVTDDNGVDYQSQKSQLVLGCVLLQQGSGVVVADGSILRALGLGDSGGRGHGSNPGETHVVGSRGM